MKKNKNSSKPVIAVDVDDVIAVHAQAFVDYSNKKYGTRLTINEYHDHWGALWNIEYEETRKRAAEYNDSGHMAAYGITEGAHGALRKLKERFTLVVLTARPTSTSQLTKEWINTHYPGIFDDFIFTGFFDSLPGGASNLTKAELARSIGAQYIIDDQLKHVLSAAEIGIKGILFGEYSWNKADMLPKNVTRVRNWQEVLHYFGHN